MIKRSILAIASVAIATALSSAHADMTGYVYQDIHYVDRLLAQLEAKAGCSNRK